MSTHNPNFPHLPLTVAKVLELDGPYFDERELLLAAWADGLSVAECRLLVAELDDERNEEFAAQQESEIWAEGASVRYAENAGWEEAEAERRWEHQQGIWS